MGQEYNIVKKDNFDALNVLWLKKKKNKKQKKKHVPNSTKGKIRNNMNANGNTLEQKKSRISVSVICLKNINLIWKNLKKMKTEENLGMRNIYREGKN